MNVDKFGCAYKSGAVRESPISFLLGLKTHRKGEALDMENHTIRNLRDPSLGTDAATRRYVDEKINNLEEEIKRYIDEKMSIYIYIKCLLTSSEEMVAETASATHHK